MLIVDDTSLIFGIGLTLSKGAIGSMDLQL
jgi:hypothetical protein